MLFLLCVPSIYTFTNWGYKHRSGGSLSLLKVNLSQNSFYYLFPCKFPLWLEYNSGLLGPRELALVIDQFPWILQRSRYFLFGGTHLSWLMTVSVLEEDQDEDLQYIFVIFLLYSSARVSGISFIQEVLRLWIYSSPGFENLCCSTQIIPLFLRPEWAPYDFGPRDSVVN